MQSKKWQLYEKGKAIAVSYKVGQAIIHALYSINELPISSLKTSRSNKIKFALTLLGYKLKYCVYTNLEAGETTNDMIHAIRSYIELNKKKLDLGNHTFNNTEWMFDLHWYRDNKGTHFMPRQLYLACESELQKRRTRKPGQIDFSGQPNQATRYDFQKLLICNAQLRLMIFTVKKAEQLYDKTNGLVSYFHKAIRKYRDLPAGSRFLFVCFIGNELYYEYLEK